MNILLEQNNLLEQIGSFMGSKIVDAAAVENAIIVSRSGVRDPKIIAGAFALYVTAKKDGQLMGQLAGESFYLYLKNTFDVDVDQFINKNINQIINTYFDISKNSINSAPISQIATEQDALNFIANFDGTMNELQDISNAVKNAYENDGLSKEYYDAFMASFNTYVAVNTQSDTVTTPRIGDSTRVDKHAFYYNSNINDTALSLADKTFRVLDSNNKALSVQEFKLLDVNINLATKKILF